MAARPDPAVSIDLVDYRHRGGSDSDLACLSSVLAYQEVVAPHTGKVPSEALLMGLGGGISLFFTMERLGNGLQTILELRYAERSYRGEFFENAAAALGVPAQQEETTAPGRAHMRLLASLDEAEPVIVFAERAHLTHCTVPEDVPGFGCRRMVICGWDADEERWLAGDRAARPFTIPEMELAVARSLISVLHSRSLRILPPTRQRGKGTLARAVRERLVGTLRAMGPGTTRTSGLAALDTLVRALSERDFQRTFHDETAAPRELWLALTGLFEAIELSGGGGGYRKLFADFLDEAAEVCDEPRLEECARDYRRLARSWSRFAAALLPDAVAPLKRSRELLVRRQQLFDRKGPASQKEREKATEALGKARAAWERKPLAGTARGDFLVGLGADARRLRGEETDALLGLAQVLAPDGSLVELLLA